LEQKGQYWVARVPEDGGRKRKKPRTRLPEKESTNHQTSGGVCRTGMLVKKDSQRGNKKEAPKENRGKKSVTNEKKKPE